MRNLAAILGMCCLVGAFSLGETRLCAAGAILTACYLEARIHAVEKRVS